MGASAYAAAQITHCKPSERVQFSCEVRDKIVSLCAEGEADSIAALTYRFGATGKIENVFTASTSNGKRFGASVQPASPRALVHQVWFDRGKTRYLITQCSGGECGARAGLAVLRGSRVLMNQQCKPVAEDKAWFARELVTFESDVEGSVSHTPLLVMQDADNAVHLLYGGDKMR